MSIAVNPVIDQSNRNPQVLYLDTGVAVFACLGNPNGAIVALVGSIAFDLQSGNLYRKTSGTGNTGWTLTGAPGLVGALGTFPPATAAAQNTGSTATPLQQITIPANALLAPAAGRLRVAASGSVAANANSKTITFQFAGVTFLTFAGAINNLAWQLFAELVVVSATVVNVTAWFNAGLGATNLVQANSPNVTVPTLTAAQVAQIVGTGVATADIVQNLMTVDIG